MDTLGTLKAQIEDWLDEDLPEERLLTAINDAIESLWLSLMRISISTFMGGPVDLHFTTPSSLLISVLDPTVPLTVSDEPSADPGKASHMVRVGFTYVVDSGAETLLSPIVTHVCGLGQVASVHFPPQIAGVLGWNCYASPEAGGLLVLANQQPLGWDAYFIEPETGFEHDPEGQYPPTENTTGDDICYLRHMETLMPDTGFMAYDQGDIHSLMMRRMARSTGISSVYQHYAFDLINQRQVEIRPSPKTQIDARIFYVKRPRRLIFDNAPIPFFAFPSLGFLRDYALGKLSLSLREFETAKNWYASAEAERLRLELMMTQMASPRNDYITPGI